MKMVSSSRTIKPASFLKPNELPCFISSGIFPTLRKERTYGKYPGFKRGRVEVRRSVLGASYDK